MKQILFILGLLLTVLVFSPQEVTNSEEVATSMKESFVIEKSAAADMQHRFEVISRDLRNSNCLTPRRHVQSTFRIPDVRVVKTAVRFLQEIRMKGLGQLVKVTEYESLRQTINYSSLYCRWGYHVYALRKIVI